MGGRQLLSRQLFPVSTVGTIRLSTGLKCCFKLDTGESVANRSVLSTLLLLVAIPASLMGVPTDAQTNAQATWEELNLPCKDEWRQTMQSPASTGDQIRPWSRLRAKPGISGLYEDRLGVLYLLAGRYDEARTVAQTALAPGTPYEKYLLSVIANADLGQGNLDSALLRYEALIKKYPEYYDGYAGVGAVNVVQHKYDKSIQYLNEAPKPAPVLAIYPTIRFPNPLFGPH